MRRLLLSASFTIAALTAQAEPLRLLAPANGDVLRGGHFATLAWSADRVGAGAEEWEAFLSVDGGHFYSVRLTPHLDIATRRFDVLIPNVDSDDVRILIRTGNERNETILTIPQRFRIRAEAMAMIPSQTRAEGPESARPNEPRVVQWSVGDHVENAATPAHIAATKTAADDSEEITLTSRAHDARSGGQAIALVRTGRIACPPQILVRPDVLLQSSRMNV